MMDFTTLPTQTIDIHGVRWEASVIIPRRSYALFNPATGEGEAFNNARALQLHIGDLKAHPAPSEPPMQIAEWSVTTTEREKAAHARRKGIHLPSGPVITCYPNPERYLQYVGEFLAAVDRYFDGVRDLMNARSLQLKSEAKWTMRCAEDEIGRAISYLVASQVHPLSFASAGD